VQDSFDLIVIGTGCAGSAPAFRCRAAGWRVAVVDDQSYGGTCAQRGCDPKKVLVGAADVVAWHNRMREHGVAGDASIDWPRLMTFKRSFTDPVSANREAALAKAGIEMFHGEASFVAEDRLSVNGRTLAAKHIVIATGAGPRPLDAPGASLVATSTDFLELDALPRRIAFVGAGYISLEFAHLARRAGAEVVVLGRGAPLPTFDGALVERLIAHTRAIGIDLRLDSPVTAIERDDACGTLRVHSGDGAAASVVETDLVVHGAGRIPNTARLGTVAGHVALDGKGAVKVNEFLQSTSNPRVYAAGDVVLPPGSMPLTPVAALDGAVVASNLLNGRNTRPDYRGIPSVVFTIPSLAAVGLTEKAAREQGLDVRVQSMDTTQWFTNRRVREPVGMFKTIVEEGSDRLIGAHLLGADAETVINIFALSIRFGISAQELKEMVYTYPTGASDIPHML
jgi:glutathione reductase (NADPH)